MQPSPDFPSVFGPGLRAPTMPPAMQLLQGTPQAPGMA